MIAPRKLSKSSEFEAEGLAWNEFINFCATEEPEDMSKNQQTAHAVFWYMSEVAKYGHTYFLLNADAPKIERTLHALKDIGDENCIANLLQIISLVSTYEESNPDESIKHIDQQFLDKYEAGLLAQLKSFFEANESEFIEWIK